jgi:hypothetical protein
MDIRDLKIKDYHVVVNALKHGPSVPARVSFHIRWSGVLRRVQVQDKKVGFNGDYIEDTATIQWSAEEKGFKFVSDPAKTSTTQFAEIGRERNGVFF